MMNEELSISRDSPIKARFYDYAHFTYPWHFHPAFEIIYVKESTGTRFVGNSVKEYFAGDILLLGSNLPHYMKSGPEYHSPTSEKRVRGTIIQFEQEFMYYSVRHYPHLRNIRQLLEDSRHGLYFPGGCSGELVRLLETIPRQTGIDQLCSFLTLLEEMASVKSRETISTSEILDPAPYAASRLDKILSYINQNYTRPIPLAEIASLGSMNPSAFCRYFRKKTGKTFTRFIGDMRIAYACKLLLVDDHSISQISSLCGFDTVSHFNRTFKNCKGMPPSRYRETMLAQ